MLRAVKLPKVAAKRVAYSSRMKSQDKKIRSKVRTIGRARKASEYSKKLAKHLKQERAKATKKNGDFKKGWSQARVMKAAHKCVKKELKRK